MKNYFLTAVGFAAMLLWSVPGITYAELNGSFLALGNRPSFYIDAPPTFIYVPELGYSVAVESPYDFISYDDYYYVYDNGYWYSSSFYNGPWIAIIGEGLPPLLRGHRIADIRRFRDIEYGKHDRQYWQNSDQHDRRNQKEFRINSSLRSVDGRRPNDGQGRNDNDGRNRGEARSGGDNRAPGNIRGAGDTHPSRDRLGGDRNR